MIVISCQSRRLRELIAVVFFHTDVDHTTLATAREENISSNMDTDIDGS